MQIGDFSSKDPSELEMALVPWHLLVDCDGSANRSFEFEYASFPGMTLCHETYNSGMRLIGMPPQDQLILAIPVFNQGKASFCGQTTKSGHLYSVTDDLYEAKYQGDLEIFSVQLDLSFQFEPSLALSVEKLLAKSRSFAIGSSQVEISRLYGAIRDVFRISPNEVSNHTQHRIDTMQDSIELAISSAVLPGNETTLAGKPGAQSAAVSAALEYLRAIEGECISVRDLCSSADVNERTLERGIRDQFDCTVIQLLKKWRLHAARRRFRASGPNDTSVSKVAMSLGFFDLGRFAAAYRQLFDEYPSATLAGPTRTISPHLTARR
ncbi:helix-turn-helix transcriptional regulator [Roseibium sp.]|uniref:helix-turn-helix transcriptional regulator n=1 Tax=Roseibium sp. TaxID=1936156 RepID=UPI003BAB748D